MRWSCVGGTNGCTMYTSRWRQLASSWDCRQSLLKRTVSDGERLVPSSLQMASARARWALPEKTTMSRTR